MIERNVEKTPMDPNEFENKRQQFVAIYASKMGWDVSSLTLEQMNEIKKQKAYQNPSMILS